jgi:3-oxoacyl-[acyl-carrier-protein] synthase I
MTPLYVVGSGAVTALGLDAPRTVASLRGGHSGLVELRFEGVTGQDLKAAPVRGFAEGLMGLARLEALAHRALEECLRSLKEPFPGPPIVYLGLRESDSELATRLTERLEARFSWKPGTIYTLTSGRTSVFAALKHAHKALESGARGCIVGGVDSLVGPSELRSLSERGLLAEEYDGFYPGEAAAFVALSRRPAVGAWGRKAAALVTGVGEAEETADGSSSAPLVGVGMSTAMRRALSDAQTTEAAIGLFINAINGTRSEFEDEAHARIRLLRTPRKELTTWHVASHLGETGAAYGALALIWASAALDLGLSSAPGVMLTASAGRRRSAVFIKPVGGELTDAEASPAVSLTEPAFHKSSCICSTRNIENDEGMRLAEADDSHRTLCERDFDELASLWAIREGHLGSFSRWTDIEDFERRALSHLDALAWSGETARELAETLLSGEPEEAAAATLLLLCTEGRQAPTAPLLEACAKSPEHLGAISSAAGLSPRRLAEPFLHQLAQVDLPSAEAAIRALSIGGWLTAEWLVQTARRLKEPVDEGVVAMGSRIFPEGREGVSDWLTASKGKGVFALEASLAALVLEPAKHWLWTLPKDILFEQLPEAVALAALQEGKTVVSLLPSELTATAGAMTALGWSGETQGTAVLLSGLDSKEEDVAQAAARALSRIYGLRPMETVTQEDVPLDRLSQVRTQWEELLKGAPPVGERQRHGKRWGKRSALDMLTARETPSSERAIALWEHTLLHRQPHPVHTQQWVATQLRALTSSPGR